MHLRELDYELPPELIAQEPCSERDGARMAIVQRHRGLARHARVLDLPTAIRPSLFVVNDTRVIPARLLARKPTGGKIEILLVEALDAEERTWLAIARGVKALRPGMVLRLDEHAVVLTVRALREHGEIEVEASSSTNTSPREAIRRAGQVPLPPYIRRPATSDDAVRYQTIFATRDGSVAAPTAGLHFSARLLEALGRAGHALARLTLHVGPGTFAPVRHDDLDRHAMHAEKYEIPSETAFAIARARAEGRPVVAVGTTVFRALEAASRSDGTVETGPGRTSLFVRPPYEPRVVNALFTNFHLPRSTLLALVMAVGGIETIRASYEACVRERYRFYSYGDAMLLLRPEDARGAE